MYIFLLFLFILVLYIKINHEVFLEEYHYLLESFLSIRIKKYHTSYFPDKITLF